MQTMKSMQTIQAVIKPNQPAPTQTPQTTLRASFLKLQSEVFEPMMKELTALESTLAGSEKDAVAEYKVAVQEFFAATSARVRGLL